MRRYPDWRSFEMPLSAADHPVAFCADLSPASVLAGYGCGLIPFPSDGEYLRNLNEFRYEDLVSEGTIALVGEEDADPYRVAWWSPDPRLVIPVHAAHLGRNVRKVLRRGQERTTANAAFRRVAQECRAGREPRWLTDALLETLVELHRDGWAHSIEVWDGDDLVGGAFGVGVGRVISGDSLFGRQPGMASIAVSDMAERLGRVGGALVDAQWDSPFLRSLGGAPMPREEYLKALAVSGERIAFPGEPLPARRLLPRGD